MNAPFFNLVSSRLHGGDHNALQRWYSDHIGILWRCPSLLRATLLRVDASDGHDADYLCFYAFPDRAGFDNYEHGPARAAAAQVIEAGWGRTGVSIAERRQYQRLWQRQSAQLRQSASAETQHVVASFDLQIPTGAWHEVARWLNEQTQALLVQPAVNAITLYRCPVVQGAPNPAGSESVEVLLVLQTQADPASLPAWRDWWQTQPAAWGQAPTAITPRWCWRGHVVQCWRR